MKTINCFSELHAYFKGIVVGVQQRLKQGTHLPLAMSPGEFALRQIISSCVWCRNLSLLDAKQRCLMTGELTALYCRPSKCSADHKQHLP